jgi:hypothetical protein
LKNKTEQRFGKKTNALTSAEVASPIHLPGSSSTMVPNPEIHKYILKVTALAKTQKYVGIL